MQRGVLGFLFAFAALAVSANPSLKDPNRVHGMLIFGRDKFYLTNLSRFESPYDYQAILVATLDEVRDRLLDDMAANPKQIYTLEPVEFSLPEMVSHPYPVPVTIYRGDFRKADGRTKFAANVMLTITESLHFRRFDPKDVAPKEVPYLIFGTRGEAYAAHYLTTAPDFIQILSITGAGAKPKAGKAEKITVERELMEGRENADAQIAARREIFREALDHDDRNAKAAETPKRDDRK